MDYNDNIYYVFAVHPHDQGEAQHSLLGKFFIHDGNLRILEDHGMVPGQDLEELSPEESTCAIRRMASSQRRKVVSAKQLIEGEYPELLPKSSRTRILPGNLAEAIQDQIDTQPKGPRVSEFEYHHEAMPAPQALKLAGHKAFLDDIPLQPEEVSRVMENIASGKAKVRHSLAKSEFEPDVLAKIEPGLSEALAQMRQAVRAGHVHPDALQTLTRHLFQDSMMPVPCGNKAAYKDFLSRPKPGVHVHLDLNQFKSVNESFGHETGNQAIMSAGKAIRSALDESVGRKNAKLFRTGGDEFIAHVPTHEHAARLARALRAKLEAIPAIGGTHHLSTSMGWGPTPEHAESALMDAKAEKNAKNYAPGQAKTHAAARMPEQHQGPVPVE
jgi:diguanylate cyclase (GGDEF)-like protein